MKKAFAVLAVASIFAAGIALEASATVAKPVKAAVAKPAAKAVFPVKGIKFTGKVKAINVAKNEMIVTNSSNKKDVTLKIDQEAINKKFAAGTVVNVILASEGSNVARKVHKSIIIPVSC